MSDTDPASPSPRFTNALINETSPYLLQHAHNPVDWYAWGSAAFDAARQTGKPILVSIGYSTCYWCHVMERESFEDESTADLMNDRFICIKVDREEHPDVDDLYMTATTIITGSGGWPMNVFLTPPPPPLSSPADNPAWIGLQPFYAGTYFPPDSGYGRPAWKEVLVAVSDAWRNRRADVLAQAGQVASDVRRQLASDDSPSPVGVGQLGSAVSTLLRIADKTHGGFGTAPKFPQPVYLEFLLDVRDFVDDAAGHRTALQAACRLTLDRMAMGGMYDQVGGGFHRYSTDPLWLVPHFEKMLYDNGQLASLYARASHLYGDPFYARIASEISTYVLREMTDPSTGAFFSAQDAEVDRREGLNYLWLIAELRSTMAAAGRADLVEFAAFVFNLDAGENFQDPHHPSEPRRNVLCLPARPEQLARESNRSLDAFNADLAEVRRILYDARRLRKQPMRDDKVLAAWNGLMIAGLADSARFLHREDFLEAAERAWDFVNTSMRAPDGTLCRSWRSGLPRIEAGAEDYAALIHGLLALAQARASNPAARDAHLADARRLAEEARLLFWDDDRGGYFDARSGRADLFLRARSLHDGAIPCANSLMLNNLIRLSELIEPDSPRSVAWRTAFLDDAFRTMESMSARIADNPLSTINATRALFHLLRLAPDRVAGLGASPAVSHQADAPSTADPLAISLSTESLDLSVSARAEVEITLSIAPGHHVAAPISSLPGRQPQEEPAFLVPLSLSLDNAPDFLTLIVDMPPARPLEMAGERIGIYSDKVTIRATLIRRGGDNRVNVTQDPRLILTCQVCTDNACLAPVNLTLPLNIILP